MKFMDWLNPQYLNAVGLSFNLIGSVFLALSIKVFDPLAGKRATMRIGGHKPTIAIVRTSFFRLGIGFLFLGFLLQLAAVV